MACQKWKMADFFCWKSDFFRKKRIFLLKSKKNVVCWAFEGCWKMFLLTGNCAKSWIVQCEITNMRRYIIYMSPRCVGLCMKFRRTGVHLACASYRIVCTQYYIIYVCFKRVSVLIFLRFKLASVRAENSFSEVNIFCIFMQMLKSENFDRFWQNW